MYRVDVDSTEKVTHYKQDDYQYDADGFLTSQGHLKYEYNSRGKILVITSCFIECCMNNEAAIYSYSAEIISPMGM